VFVVLGDLVVRDVTTRGLGEASDRRAARVERGGQERRGEQAVASFTVAASR